MRRAVSSAYSGPSFLVISLTSPCAARNFSFDAFLCGCGFRFLFLFAFLVQYSTYDPGSVALAPSFARSPAAPRTTTPRTYSCSRTFWIRFPRFSISSQVIVYPINAPCVIL